VKRRGSHLVGAALPTRHDWQIDEWECAPEINAEDNTDPGVDDRPEGPIGVIID
jgi:hypothetical protein